MTRPADITLEAIGAGRLTLADIAIAPATLMHQAAVARANGRPLLAENFERAAEMSAMPSELILQCYEILRPGRPRDAAAIGAMAQRLREEFHAHRIAALMDEAARAYKQRNLFVPRY